MYKHLFGPVPSRRLGMSLGVDLVPHKVCSLNCVYCECGGTTSLTSERKEYVPLDELREELLDFFDRHPDPDFITFSGAGEPTLNVRLGEVLAFIKANKPGVKTALITNSTLFTDPGLRAEVMHVDVVLPSLDAASERAFRKINRPGKKLKVEDYVEGLVEFSREYKGSIWLEVLIIPGYNDDEENLAALAAAIRRIGPEKIQLNTLDRPGVLSDLRPASAAELEQIAALLGLEGAELVLPKPSPANQRKSPSRHEDSPSSKENSTAGPRVFREDVESAILELITRRPCTLQDLEQLLGLHSNEINEHLRFLEGENRIEQVEQERGTFYQIRL